tara:strand:+ start:518 stop:952 length:435 start_codon:yes stop_codon:yes gene_type:complete
MSLGIFKNGMKKVYHYIFYKLYRYMLTTPNSNLALNGAVIYLSIGLLFNSITINLLLNKFFKLYAMSGNLFLTIGLCYSFLIYYFNHWYFKKDNLYLKIEERFSVESKRQKALGNIFVFVFVVGSVIFFMLTGYLVNKYFGGFK